MNWVRKDGREGTRAERFSNDGRQILAQSDYSIARTVDSGITWETIFTVPEPTGEDDYRASILAATASSDMFKIAAVIYNPNFNVFTLYTSQDGGKN